MTTCYACNEPSTSREHVPPRLLFPERKDAEGSRDFRKGLITVPSCESHNSEKSQDDMYLLWVLSTNLCANPIAQRQAMTKLARSHLRRPALGSSILDNSRSVKVEASGDQQIHDAEMCELDGARFERSLDLVARGLYLHHVGEQWLGPLHVHADFVDHIDDPNKAELDDARRLLFEGAKTLFANEPQHGENPDVFWFKVLKPPHTWDLMMRFAFYSGCTATAFFGGTADSC